MDKWIFIVLLFLSVCLVTFLFGYFSGKRKADKKREKEINAKKEQEEKYRAYAEAKRKEAEENEKEKLDKINSACDSDKLFNAINDVMCQ